MDIQEIEQKFIAKLKKLADLVELPFETAEKYLHNQLDSLIGGAKSDAINLKAHIEEVAAKTDEEVDTAAKNVEAEVKTDIAAAAHNVGDVATNAGAEVKEEAAKAAPDAPAAQ